MFEFTLADRTMGHFSTPPIMLYFSCVAPLRRISAVQRACMHTQEAMEILLYYVLILCVCVGQFRVETPTNGALPTAG